jgi:hypothetical protein
MRGVLGKSGSREDGLQRIAVAAALITVAIFLVWSAIRIHGLLAVLYQNSDIASAPVMAQLLGERGSGEATLGYYPWLEPLYALHLTRWLPDHRVAWEILPFAVLGATIALVGWTVRRTVSAVAGLAAAVAMATPAPLVIWMLGAPNMRLFTLAHAVILAAFLITVPAMAAWGRVRRAIWAAALALSLAAGASSDPLVLIGAALPFLVAVVGGWALGAVRSGTATVAASACLAGVAGGWLFEKLAEHDGIVYFERNFGLTSLHQMVTNVGLLFQDVALFVHGRLGGNGALGLLLEIVAWAAFVGLPVLALLALPRLRRAIGGNGVEAGRRLLAMYWAAAAIAVGLAFIASTAAEDISAVRYMTILWPALLTLGLIAWPRRGPTVVSGLAAVTALIGCFELADDRYAAGDPRVPQGPEVPELAEFVKQNRLDHGYAAYWDAAALTDRTDFQARTYPIQKCGASGDERCRWPFHTIEAWYRSKAGVRTYYLTNDTGLPAPIGPPPKSWGRPSERVRIGHLTLYVYDFDLASRLGPPEG